ncbi:MAG TPA: DUF5110 domain-containing protein, partial [Chitinophagaceae bacterium]
VRGGGIVPLQSVVQHTKEKGDGVLYVHVWEGNQETSFSYYEDDGETYGYESGKYLLREFRYLPAKRQLQVSAASGDYTSKFNTIKVIWHSGGKTKEQTLPFNSTAMTVSLP